MLAILANGVWRVSGGFLEGVWGVSGGCLEGVWRVSRCCLRDPRLCQRENGAK